MSSIRFLRTFVAAAHAGGSFTAAAEKVSLTQAAIGLQMRSLEAELGQTLFDRSGRAMVLSAAGRSLLPRAERLLADYDALRRNKPDPNSVAGTIRIGTIITAIGLLSRTLVALKALHPALDVQVQTREVEELSALVGAGELDAALVIESSLGNLDGLRWTRLYEEPFVVIASSAVASPGSDIGDLLRTQPFLRVDRRTPTGARIEKTLRRRRFTPKEFIELNSIASIVELVREGAGVTLVPLLRAYDWARDPALCVLPLPGRPVARWVGMVERAQGTSATGVVREHLEARLLRMDRRFA
jgi:DNA-binding transcriptional LysR family regulator